MVLKFRRITPKPVAMAPAPMPAPVTATGAASKGKKRKAAAAGGGRRPKKAAAVVTEVPPTRKVGVHKEDKHLSSPSSSSSGTTSADSSTPPPPPATLMHAPSPEKEGFSGALHAVGHVADLQALRPVASCVTVESVIGTWRDDEAPHAAACGGDEAPAFVSDRWGRVTRMNLAFSRVVSGGGGGDAASAPSASDAAAAPFASDAGVVLAAKDGAAVPAWGTCAGFTCRMRVSYSCPRRGGSLVAPCDVWRLDAGGYLWQLDLQATLTLSLGGLP
jgi:hypothetical protein